MNIQRIQLQKEPFFHPNCHVNNMTSGKYVEIGEKNFIENVHIDDFSYTGQFCFIQNSTIGKFSNIAAMVHIGPTAHPYERASLHHFTYRPYLYGWGDDKEETFFEKREKKRTLIGHDTWIGRGAIIFPNVKIGNGAIVGAGAVVTKNVPPYAIVAGVPATIIKYRFDDETITALQRLAWWDWPESKIQHALEDFKGPIHRFIQKYEKE